MSVTILTEGCLRLHSPDQDVRSEPRRPFLTGLAADGRGRMGGCDSRG
jgi:hypothetical protein